MKTVHIGLTLKNFNPGYNWWKDVILQISKMDHHRNNILTTSKILLTNKFRMTIEKSLVFLELNCKKTYIHLPQVLYQLWNIYEWTYTSVFRMMIWFFLQAVRLIKDILWRIIYCVFISIREVSFFLANFWGKYKPWMQRFYNFVNGN